jgi:hypothetical protein
MLRWIQIQIQIQIAVSAISVKCLEIEILFTEGDINETYHLPHLVFEFIPG